MNRMKNIYNLKTIIKATAFVMVMCVVSIHSAYAWDTSSYCGALTYRKDAEINEEFDNDEVKQKIKERQAFDQKYKDFCKKFQSYLEQTKKEKKELGGTKDFDSEVFRQYNLLKSEDYQAYQDRFKKMLEYSPTLKKEYEALIAEDEAIAKEVSEAKGRQLEEHKKAKESGEYVPCGDKYPRGCPAGKKCFSKRTGHNIDETNVGYVAYTSFDCLDPNDVNLLWTEAPKGSEGSGSSMETNVAGAYTKLTTDETRQTHVETNMGGRKKRDNSACQIQRMQTLYQDKCYACVIVKTLLETFLVACSQVYDLTSEAGSKILVIGAMIWLAFFALKNVSSFANVEPGAMVNTLFVFLFKVMVAYIVINSGLTTIIHYTINPIVTAGADYGLGLMSTMKSVSGAEYSVVVPTITSADGKTTADIISADVINKIMNFTFNLDKTVSTNLVIGHALTCHSINAGAWDLGLFYMVNIWIWLCGAAIWFVGFMLTLGICYYLLDISFKLGFAIIALPVVIGLWPFNVTKDKLTLTISIILSSAATFAFLALTTTYALVLIDASLRDLPTLFDAINQGKADWISETFDISGPYFLIIIFAYLYAMKLISSTITDYVDKFFGDGVFGGQSPMHSKMTQATDFAKQKVTGAASAVGGAVKTQVGKGAEKVLGKAVGFVKSSFKRKGKTNNNKGSSNTVSNAGSATKAAGKTMQQTGQATQQAGQMAQKGGKMMSKGGDGMMKAGKALSGTGLGAIIGVPMMIAGGAIKGAGAVTEYAGKATKKAGQAMKKSGKAMQKIGDKMEKAGNKMEQAGNTMKYGKGGSPASNTPPQNPPSSNSSGGTTP